MDAGNHNVFQTPHLIRGFRTALGGIVDRDEGEITGACAKALLADAVQSRATDIHLDSQLDEISLRFRIDGALHQVASLPTERDLHLLRHFKVNTNLDPAPSLHPEDSHFEFEVGGKALDVRLACAPCLFGDKLALRLLRRSSVKHRLSDLGLPNDDHARIAAWPGDISGMFLVTGPVGSGKTTTLYAPLSELHLTDRHIVTIEDPVDELVYYLILAGNDEHALREHLRTAGFRTLLCDALDKAAEGITDFSELTRMGIQSYLGRVPDFHASDANQT